MQIPGLGKVEKDEDLGWYFGPPMTIPVLGGMEYCVVVDGYDGDSRPEDFHAAIANFLSLGDAALKQAAPFVFAYYKDCVATAGTPVKIGSPAEVWKHLRFGDEPQVTRRAHGDKGIYVSVACSCDWESEHGLQIVFKDGLVVNKVGAFDGHVTNSDAYDDARFEDVIYVDRATLQRRIAARKNKPAPKTSTSEKTTKKAAKPTKKATASKPAKPKTSTSKKPTKKTTKKTTKNTTKKTTASKPTKPNASRSKKTSSGKPKTPRSTKKRKG